MKGQEDYELSSGDQITVGMTHQIQIGRDNSWIKFEVVTRLRPGEVTDDARARAIHQADAGVMQAVHQAVETIRSQQ